MYDILSMYDFPNQKIPSSKKDKVWAAQCCDWIIAKGIACKNTVDLQNAYDILNQKITEEDYKKILNPYNATKEKFKKFPATLRNYDFITGVIRRYVGEYLRSPHTFIVGANNPEVVINKNLKLKSELSKIVNNAINQQIQQLFADFIKQGNDPQEFNPQEQIDIEAFIKNFEENYIDDISKQGQDILNIIKDITEDNLIYARAYNNFVSFGETYTYSDVRGTNLIKQVIEPIDAFPIPTDEFFVEDDDMFACRRKMSYNQIITEFDEYLSEKDKEFIDSYYNLGTAGVRDLTYKTYASYYGDICDKYNQEDRKIFDRDEVIARETNSGLYNVWHVVWKGFVRVAVVSYINESGFMDIRIEDDSYKLNPEIGDISIDYEYKPQVYECVRIGGRSEGIYPYGARAIAYDRNGKLPYNGIKELLPGLGKFSIVEILAPYQIFYNIVAYAREMAIAKVKLSVLMIAKSLLGRDNDEREATIYKMLADGVLYIDDSEDSGMLRAQQVRMLNSDVGTYIQQLSELLNEIKYTALEQVDMNVQRYGEIGNHAGKGVTEEAIARGSMGSVIIEFIMDYMRERDYARDMDFSKLAWIDGLDTGYRDENKELKYISLNVEQHIYADYNIKAKFSVEERDKLQQLKQLAFSAAQNGDMKMAVAAIEGDNIASISKLIDKFEQEKNQHELSLKQLDQQMSQMENEFELQKIAMKGEEDRKTAMLKGQIDKEIELIRADSNMISYNANVGTDNLQSGIDRLNQERVEVDKAKVNVAREKNILDALSKAEDRRIKEKDIDTKLKIAKTNKNKYDK